MATPSVVPIVGPITVNACPWRSAAEVLENLTW
jgi:hypothetical protein